MSGVVSGLDVLESVDWGQVLTVVWRSVLVYIALLVLTRIGGTKLFSQMTYADFVVATIIGTISGSIVTDGAGPGYMVVSLVVLTALVVLSGFISLRSITARKLLDGEPVVVVQNGKILERNMRRARYNIDKLLMHLRDKGAFDMSEVEFAVLEPDGRLSVLKKSQNLPVTPEDIGTPTDYKGVPSELVVDGRVIHQNLRQNNLSDQWLREQLSNRGIKDVRDVLLATLETDGTLYVDIRTDNMGYVQKVEDDDSLI